MTDNLRDRIAAVLNHHKTDDRYNEWADCQCGRVGTRWDDHVADAVIEALREERTCELCGRTGTQKYRETRTGWVCRSIPACDRRANRD